MSVPSPATSVLRLSTSKMQKAWAIGGLVILLVTLTVAFSNLQEIYDAQKDFVVGSLLSLSGFCFGRALTRTTEQKALELIHTAPTEEISTALRERMSVRLHDVGAFEQLSRLERNVDAAVERLSEYYDAQSQRLDFYRHAPLLRVALDDLDKAAANVVDLRRTLRDSADGPALAIPPTVRLALVSVRRDLREALNRRDQAYEWLAARLDRAEQEEAWDLFAVMTADIIKGTRTLEALLSQHAPYPADEYLRTVVGYLEAAVRRAGEFAAAVGGRGITLPKIFDVMLDDLSKAIGALRAAEPARAEPTSAEPARTGDAAG
jgi:hypothetical protein